MVQILDCIHKSLLSSVWSSGESPTWVAQVLSLSFMEVSGVKGLMPQVEVFLTSSFMALGESLERRIWAKTPGTSLEEALSYDMIMEASEPSTNSGCAI